MKRRAAGIGPQCQRCASQSNDNKYCDGLRPCGACQEMGLTHLCRDVLRRQPNKRPRLTNTATTIAQGTALIRGQVLDQESALATMMQILSPSVASSSHLAARPPVAGAAAGAGAVVGAGTPSPSTSRLIVGSPRPSSIPNFSQAQTAQAASASRPLPSMLATSPSFPNSQRPPLSRVQDSSQAQTAQLAGATRLPPLSLNAGKERSPLGT